jgi:hypothetical protein
MDQLAHVVDDTRPRVDRDEVRRLLVGVLGPTLAAGRSD